MSTCATYTGILFSRKPCAQAGVLTCGRCKNSVCKQHLRPQASGPFLCPNCDAYTNDDDWRYSSRDNGWHYRDRSRSHDETTSAATGAAAGAVAGDLAEEDKAGLAANAGDAWHGPDGADAEAAAGSDSDEGDFDAS